MMDTRTPIPIALVDDHRLIRHGLRLVLENSGLFRVVMEAGNGKEFTDALAGAPLIPQLALVDLSMPVMNGEETIRHLGAHYPAITCIALSVHNDFESVFKMISSGAKAYLLKDCEPELMKETLLQVHTHGSFYDSFVVDSLMSYQQAGEKETIIPSLQQFSAREREFILHCCSEKAYKEIADLMNVSPRTVDGYRESVFSKLNLKTRTGIVLYAIRNHLYLP